MRIASSVMAFPHARRPSPSSGVGSPNVSVHLKIATGKRRLWPDDAMKRSSASAKDGREIRFDEGTRASLQGTPCSGRQTAREFPVSDLQCRC